MAKKKTSKNKSDNSAFSISEILGFFKIFQNERLHFFLGLLLFVISIYTALSFISFITTGAADQSVIENLRDGELANQNHEFANSCGSLGAYLSSYFIKHCFGLSAFLIPVTLFINADGSLASGKPCLLCRRMLRNAKLARVVYYETDGSIVSCRPDEIHD